MKPSSLTKFLRVRYREFILRPMETMDAWSVDTELGVPYGVAFPTVKSACEFIDSDRPLAPDACGYLPILSTREIVLNLKTESEVQR